MRPTLPFLVALVCFFGCGLVFAAASGPDDLSGISETPNVDYETQIQPLWNSACAGCHGNSSPAAGLDLSAGNSFAALVNVVSTQVAPILLIKANDVAGSYSFEKINYATPTQGGRMGNMSLADQALVRDWINQGALAAASTGNNNPVVDSGPTFLPASPQANDTVNFTVTASDADGDTLTFSWDFGDGSAAGTGATPSHAYAADGNYTVTVTVSDGNGGSATGNTTVTVGSGGGTGGTFSVTKLIIKLNFKKTDKDKFIFQATVPLAANFDPNGAVVTVDIGGATFNATLDAKGKAKTVLGVMMLKLKKEVWYLKAISKNDNHAADLTDDGLTNADNKDGSATLAVTVTISGQGSSDNVMVDFKAKAGKKLSAKKPKA